MEYRKYEELLEKISKKLKSIKNCYAELGFMLIDLNNKDYISTVENFDLGRECKNIYELAKLKFNICKSTTINLIGIAKRFCDRGKGLLKEYIDYGYTQLSEMLSLTDEQLKLVNIDMTAQEIRSLRKVFKNSDQLTGQLIDSQDLTNENNLLKLKTQAEISAFLGAYQSWGVWLTIPQLNVKLYKCNLSNSAFLVVGEVEYYDHNDKGQLKFNHNFIRIIDQKLKSPYEYFKFESISEKEVYSYFYQTKCKILNPSECFELPKKKKPIDVNKFKKEKLKANQNYIIRQLKTASRVRHQKIENEKIVGV